MLLVALMSAPAGYWTSVSVPPTKAAWAFSASISSKMLKLLSP